MMVDDDRRTFIKKAATSGGIALGLAGVGWGGYTVAREVYRGHERKDNAIEPRAEERQIRNAYGETDWTFTAVDPDRIDVSLEATGATEQGVTRYTASAVAPLVDEDIRICPHAVDPGSTHALGEKLEEDAIRLFDRLYDKTARLTRPYRDVEEERVATYRVGFEDASGVATADITGREAYQIAQEADWFGLDNGTDRENFLEVYRKAFDARCRDDG